MIHTSRLLGYTRSKKKICAYNPNELEFMKSQTHAFTPSDHFDAVCAFEYLTLRSLRKYGFGSVDFENMRLMSAFHNTKINSKFTKTEKKNLALITSIDICNYGKNLLLHFLRE